LAHAGSDAPATVRGRMGDRGDRWPLLSHGVVPLGCPGLTRLRRIHGASRLRYLESRYKDDKVLGVRATSRRRLPSWAVAPHVQAMLFASDAGVGGVRPRRAVARLLDREAGPFEHWLQQPAEGAVFLADVCLELGSRPA